VHYVSQGFIKTIINQLNKRITEYMKKFISAVTLLLASSSAFAGIITQTGEFGEIGSSTTSLIEGQNFNEMISIAGFDGSYGTLTGIEINVQSQITTGGYIVNDSTELGRANYSVTIASDLMVSTEAADNHSFVSGSFMTPLLSGASSTSGYTLAAGEQFEFHQSSDLFSYNLTNVDLTAFLSGPVDFVFSAFVFTNAQAGINSGVNEFKGLFTTASFGKVTVSYTYDDITTSVPEPTSIAILALGLVGLRLRKKKSA
jgi:hypothetical protein